jgi:hypothetical protein
VVWSLPLPAGSEGPSLIPHAAWLPSVGLFDLLSAPSWHTIIRVPFQQGLEAGQESLRTLLDKWKAA